MPDESRQIPPADSESVQEAIENARRNWNEWRSVFEHAGSVDNNPLLTNPELFNKFVQEYSVGRTIWTGQRELFHFKLRGTEFIDAIQDDTAMSLQKVANGWREDFGTISKNNPTKPVKAHKAIISILSKIAAFLRPETFLAWDTYAKRGLNIASGKPASRSFQNNYCAYLEAVNAVWNGEIGQAIRDITAQSTEQVEREPRFQRRVLDLYLMKLGGRNININN